MLELSEKAFVFCPSGKWEKTNKPKFFELLSKSTSAKVQAEDICKAENDIYDQAQLHGHAYSLLFGPCESGTTRVCVLRGIWRTDGRKTISALS